MLTVLNCFALCTNFTLLQEDLMHTRSSRVRIGGLGSARCRKICSLKRHVPFDALYIIHKVKAVTVPFRARSLYLEENAERSISRPNSDNFCRTPAIAISIIVARSSIILIVGIDQHFCNFQCLRVRANILWRNETFVYGTSTLCQCRFSIITLHGRRAK